MSWGHSDELPDGRPFWNSFSYPIYKQLRAQNQVLQDLFAYKSLGRSDATIDGIAQSADVQLVSGNFYQQMQVQPMLGRAILPSDDAAPGTGAVVVISYGLWSRIFRRSPDVIGRVVTVNMTPVTIVGANAKGITGAESAQQSPEFFMPLSMMPLMRAPMGDSGPILSSEKLYWLQVMGRTKPGVSLQQASSALDVSLAAAVRATTTIEKGETLPHILLMDASKGQDWATLRYAEPLHVLLAMVGAVLLMACANMANLMLARASARQREMSVRLALGASRGRILRQVLTESLLLSSLGGALGLLLGYFGRTALPKLLADSWAYAEVDAPFNWKVFAFTAAITIGTGILFGIFPAWAATRAEVGVALKQAGKTATRRRKAWSGKAIVAFQVALPTLLVAAAALFLRWNRLHRGNENPNRCRARLWQARYGDLYKGSDHQPDSARKCFPRQNPIGKRFTRDDKLSEDTKWIQIVGLCADFRSAYLRRDPPPLFLALYRQQVESGSLTYIVRTSMKPEAIVPSLRTAVHRIDPDLPLMDVRTQMQQNHANLQQERMFASLTSGFGVLAIMLACVGLYGIMAYTVVQRTNEIGIRLALGAKRRQVRFMVLSEVGWLTTLGVVAGLAVTLGAARAVKSMLYGVRPADPWSLAGADGLLLLVALVSGWVPAMRASRVEPMEALRHE